MPPKVPVQLYSFSAGILDRSMRGRLDIKAYYSGALTATNLTPLPLGGMTKRPGWRMVAEIPDATAAARLGVFKYASDAAYLLVFTDTVLRIFHGRAQVKMLTGTPFTSARLSTLDWSQQLATMVLTHPDFKPKRLIRQGTHTDWALDDVPLTGIPTQKFSDGAVGTDGSITAEAVWSDARGWPISVVFHQGRTYFGGSRSLPDTLWGSNAGDNWAFDERQTSSSDTTPLDDTAVSAAVAGGGGQRIRRLLATDDMFIFSDGGAWTVASSTSAIAPDSFLPLMQSEVRASTVRPIVVEGSVVYMSAADDGAHSSPHELTWDDQAQGYYARDLALRCPSIMRKPVEQAVRVSSDGSSAATVLVVNSDGTVAVLTPNRFENLTAWTTWETDGQVLGVAVVVNTVFLLVRRTIAGVPRVFLECQDTAARLDCSMAATAATAKTVWSGFDHLKDHAVTVVADDKEVLRLTVAADGSITLPYPATSIEVGLGYGWTLEPMPPEAQLSDGTLVGHRYRIVRASVRVEDTQELWINGQHMSFRRFDRDSFGGAPPVYSGVVNRSFLGWTRDGTVKLQGFGPFSATILSATLEIAQ